MRRSMPPEEPYARLCGLFAEGILGCRPLLSRGVPEASFSWHPATPQEAEAAPGRPVAPLAAHSPLGESSATARDPAGAVRGRRDGARYGIAGTGPADTPRRRSPAHRTARSTGAPPALCEPADSCPAPATPSPAQVSPPDPAAVRTPDSGIVQHSAAAVPPPKAPYGESRQPVCPGVEHEPDGRHGATVLQWVETRRGRRSQHPRANGTWLRSGDAPSLPAAHRCMTCGSAGHPRCCPRGQRPRLNSGVEPSPQRRVPEVVTTTRRSDSPGEAGSL